MGARNPWIDLPRRAPYVLPSDRPAVDRYNRRASVDHRIVLDLLPEPFLGKLTAPVVLLNLNPGYSEADHTVHARRRFRSALRSTIIGKPGSYPFYYLDPAEEGAGHSWWRRRLAPLVDATSPETVARGVLCLEWFPYHSRRFRHAGLSLPSQRFTFGILERAIRRNAIVIVMRAVRLWQSAVPELGRYRQCFGLNSAQNVTVSPKNCPAGFDRAVHALFGSRSA